MFTDSNHGHVADVSFTFTSFFHKSTRIFEEISKGYYFVYVKEKLTWNECGITIPDKTDCSSGHNIFDQNLFVFDTIRFPNLSDTFS